MHQHKQTTHKGGLALASTKVIATTWSKKDLVKKLKETLKRMDDEIVEWEKNHATVDRRQKAWDKKAEAWMKKNLSKMTSFEFNTGGYKGPNAQVYFDKETLEAELGERPEETCRPNYKRANYGYGDTSDYDQVQNAIALIEGATDTEFKINTTSVWASFIR
jgi:hypothetical protein